MKCFVFTSVFLLFVAATHAIQCYTCIKYKTEIANMLPKFRIDLEPSWKKMVKELLSKVNNNATKEVIVEDIECPSGDGQISETLTDCGNGTCFTNSHRSCSAEKIRFGYDVRFCMTSDYAALGCDGAAKVNDVWQCTCQGDECNGDAMVPRDDFKYKCVTTISKSVAKKPVTQNGRSGYRNARNLGYKPVDICGVAITMSACLATLSLLN